MKAEGRVLVLNSTYEYLHRESLRKAIKKLELGKAEVIEVEDDKIIKLAGDVRPYPSVIRLLKEAHFKKRPMSFTRRRVFVRDLHTCQYCGATDSKMTIDHVHPQSKGGKSTWENCVAACLTCNKQKADMLYDDFVKKYGKRLKKKPVQPDFRHFLKCSSVNAKGQWNPKWQPYLSQA